LKRRLRLEECNKLKEKQVKVFSFYLKESAKAAVDEIASMTGGESKKLDCNDAESLVHAVC
jgi:Mg-chelatase subunit ChlD